MKKNNFISDFKKFINKGNIFELATGIIIGSAFTAVVNSLVNDLIMPLISRAINFDLTSARWILSPEITDEAGEIIKAEISIKYGTFIQMLLNFLLVALAIFIAIQFIKKIKDGYIRHQIKYVKNLKKKHPEFFDEKDEYGTILYEKLKKEHPEYFKNEKTDKIEKEKPKEDPQEIMIRLLQEINENTKQMNENKKNLSPSS